MRSTEVVGIEDLDRQGNPRSRGPGVWACVECAGGLAPTGKTEDGSDNLPHLTKHMLANDNWGGMLAQCIRELNPLELMFLLPLRTVRRRWHSKRSAIMFLLFTLLI